MKTTKLSKGNFWRMFHWGWRQNAQTKVCPESPSLHGKIVVITGGNRSIGLETVKGLLKRGAEVITLSRNEEKASFVNRGLGGNVHFVKLDLADIASIETTVRGIEGILKGRTIDILINNAGIALRGEQQVSPQGYELTFAVNVLGHHVLFKQLHSKLMLAPKAHIIAVTGDIYIQADDCTPHFEGKGGVQAYARSKVGVMWWAYQCLERYPQYKVNIVHPGVIPAGLGNDPKPWVKPIVEFLMISAEGGAQTTLICATQPDVVNGGYYHNTLGRMLLHESDIALNKSKAERFWEQLETLYRIHVLDFKTVE